MPAVTFNPYVEIKYVRRGVDPHTENEDDFLAKRYSYGVHERGYTERGLLHMPHAREPNLIIGVERLEYMGDVSALQRALKLHTKGESKLWLKRALAAGTVMAGVVLALMAASAPLGAAVIGKGVAMGAVVGAGMGAVTYKLNKEQSQAIYRDAIMVGLMLTDMLDMMHLGTYAGWMRKPEHVMLRRNANPAVFDRASAELHSLGIALPWAAALPPSPLMADSLRMPELPLAGRFTRLVSPERDAS